MPRARRSRGLFALRTVPAHVGRELRENSAKIQNPFGEKTL